MFVLVVLFMRVNCCAVFDCWLVCVCLLYVVAVLAVWFICACVVCCLVWLVACVVIHSLVLRVHSCLHASVFVLFVSVCACV